MGFCEESIESIEMIQKYFREFPVAKQFVENGFQQTVRQSRHSIAVKDFSTALALKHSLSSAADWSSALGGPRISTIKRACKPRINILPFIDSEN